MTPPTLEQPPAGMAAVKQEASNLKSSVSTELSQTGEKLKEEAKGALSHLKDAGSRFASGQKETLSQKVQEYSQALNAAAGKLEESDETNPLATPAHALAQQLSRLSDYLRSSGPSDLMDGLSQTARRRPELVFGGLFLAGLLGARFLKASGKPRSNGYGRGQESDRWRGAYGRSSWEGQGSQGSGSPAGGYSSGYGQGGQSLQGYSQYQGGQGDGLSSSPALGSSQQSYPGQGSGGLASQQSYQSSPPSSYQSGLGVTGQTSQGASARGLSGETCEPCDSTTSANPNLTGR